MEAQKDYKISGSRIEVAGQSIDFKAPIEKCLRVSQGLIVLLDHRSNDDRNVYLVSASGDILWRIESFGASPSEGPNPYTGIYLNEGGQLQVYNYLGYLCEVDLQNGSLGLCEYAQH